MIKNKNEQRQEKVKVGWVQRAHGLLGELYIRLYNFPPDWLEENQLESIFLRSPQGEEVLELSVKRLRFHKEGFILHCCDISDRNQAESLKGYSMEISRAYLVAKKEGEMYLNEILNFEVHVEGRGLIGKIEAFRSHSLQDVLLVRGSDSHDLYEIPFVDEYIIKICYEISEVHMKLPQGLLELYGRG